MNLLLIPPLNRSYKQQSASGRWYMFSPATDCVMRCFLNKSDAEYTYCTLLQTHWKLQQHFLSNSGPQSLKNENMNFLGFACNCRDISETVLCTKTAALLSHASCGLNDMIRVLNKASWLNVVALLHKLMFAVSLQCCYAACSMAHVSSWAYRLSRRLPSWNIALLCCCWSEISFKVQRINVLKKLRNVSSRKTLSFSCAGSCKVSAWMLFFH